MLNLPIQKFQICLYTFSIVLATAAIVLRLLARRYTRTKLQLNDWIMLLAYVHVLALGIAANTGKSKSKQTHEEKQLC
jgi:nitrate reductase gamma subunit